MSIAFCFAAWENASMLEKVAEKSPAAAASRSNSRLKYQPGVADLLAEGSFS